MTRSIAFTSLTLLATIAAAPLAAQAQSGSSIAGHVPGDVGNIVGGGGATLTGGGDDMVIVHSGGGAGGGGGLSQLARSAHFTSTNGDGLQVGYQGLVPAGRGRAAWLISGGDNAEVVYASSTQR